MKMQKKSGISKVLVAVAGIAAAVASVPSHALIVATDLTQAGTDITSQADTVATWAIPIIGAVLAVTIGIKLFKRFANAV